ncbi:MAG TPA: ABC-F family ATP-binding cassette domain-containing protein [Anaerolineaceae bacterium]|nr:ABC-F family ATP-binding cassette domain-containing protein [Anaerolineaceae bacterium]
MLTVTQISKKFGIEPVLQEVTFNLNPGERLALVGPNGCGKTTLLRILVGEEIPDSGGFHLSPASARVGYLAQGDIFKPDETIGRYLDSMVGNIGLLSAELEQLATALANDPDTIDLQDQYDHLLTRMESAVENAGRVQTILAGLGLANLDQDMPVTHLSGGQKTRLALAGVLLSHPDVLLLDEPTNHLDLEMLTWLEDWLLGFPKAVLVVSHDRAFLDRIATGILEIDPKTHRLRAFDGNYTAYLEQKLAERERQMQAYQDQQEEIKRLDAAARRVRSNANFRKGGKADTGDKFAKAFFANRSLETMRRAKALENRLEYLRTEGRVERPGRSWQMKVDFGETPESGRTVLTLSDLSVGYGDLVLIKGITEQVRFGDRVALVGPNGCGKTTLLRTIAGLVEPLAGSLRLGTRVRLGYMRQEQEDLNPAHHPLETIQRETGFAETEARQFLSYYLFTQDDVFIPVGNLSFGERARLMLAVLVVRGCNFLMLDEPINHLDIPSRARFEQALSGFDGTILAVVHDRYFIEGFARTLWLVENGSLRRVEKEIDF